MTEFIKSLNNSQLDAVSTTEGPILIIAGPGSGKTRVITSRIAYLIQNQNISPYKIAAVTFTNKAANEMQDRIKSILGNDSLGLTTKTFHAFCAMVLRQHGESIGISKEFVVFDDADQLSVIKKSMDENNIDSKKFSARNILTTISNSKSQLVNYEGFIKTKSNYYDEIVARVFERYTDIIENSGGLDFDDLLLKTHLLFKQNSTVLNHYQERFQYLMIDEFQDTNIAQYEIAKQLSANSHNLCVVGDPDQSIYSWRNADIRNILSFKDDFPKAKIITLEENYRSSKTILDAAKNLINNNSKRVDKDLWTNNKTGTPILLVDAYNEEEEARKIIREIITLKNAKNSNLQDIAIMYRVNAQSRSFEMACQKFGVPYQIVGGIKFYQRKEIKDLTAYLRVILNSDDDVSLERIVNTPTRGIGQRTLNEIRRIADSNSISLFAAITLLGQSNSNDANMGIQLGKRALSSISDFYKIITSIQRELNSDEISISRLITITMKITGLIDAIDSDEKSEEKFENIEEYKSSTKPYEEINIHEGLSNFLESIALVSDVDTYESESDLITLITLHQAKGLEFSTVFIAGMEEGLLPHIRSIETGDPSELEEERRLCYVGITRAKKQLYVSKASRRGFRGSTEPSIPSRFLHEIPSDLIKPINDIDISTNNPIPKKSPIRKIIRKVNEPKKNQVLFNDGDKVNHPKFGDGIIISSEVSGNDYKLTITFKNDVGIKKLMAGMSNLKKI
jgi:DNA helicase-2/ATP-dependent DNA helicase PcrA